MRTEERGALGDGGWAVLRTVHHEGQASRKRIALKSRFSLVKTSRILKCLLDQGLVVRVKKKRPGSGRPRYLYGLDPDIGHSLGVSIDNDTIRVVAINARGAAVEEREVPYRLAEDPEGHAGELVSQIAGRVRDFGPPRTAEVDKRVIVGVSLPGLTDCRRGVWLQGLQLSGIDDVAMAEILEREIGLPVIVEDEARSVAYLEKTRGLGRGVAHFVLLYLGVGVGTGVVINHHLYRGFHGIAGEIGHVPVHGNSYRCSCGNVGCLETVVSVPGILRVFRDRLQEGVKSDLQRGFSRGDHGPSIQRILEAAQRGDKLTQSSLFELGGYVGEACTRLIQLFNPQKILISGLGSIFREYWQSPLTQAVGHSVIPKMLRGVTIEFCDYQPNHEAYGAALLAFRRYWERQPRMQTVKQGEG